LNLTTTRGTLKVDNEEEDDLTRPCTRIDDEAALGRRDFDVPLLLNAFRFFAEVYAACCLVAHGGSPDLYC
jgi:hypothetical protein